MQKSILKIAAATIVILGNAGIASAKGSMKVGGVTSQPVGHYEFCQNYPSECRQMSSGAKVKLSRALWAQLISINDAVNTMVRPRTDMEMWGREEFWSYPGSQGDCEDYVLEKRRQLIAMGVPTSALLITVVLQPNSAGHAVLTVSTDMGDFILDNLEPRVLAWDQTEYRYIKRQSSKNSGVWVSISDRRTRSVGSVNR